MSYYPTHSEKQVLSSIGETYILLFGRLGETSTRFTHRNISQFLSSNCWLTQRNKNFQCLHILFRPFGKHELRVSYSPVNSEEPRTQCSVLQGPSTEMNCETWKLDSGWIFEYFSSNLFKLQSYIPGSDFSTGLQGV